MVLLPPKMRCIKNGYYEFYFGRKFIMYLINSMSLSLHMRNTPYFNDKTIIKLMKINKITMGLSPGEVNIVRSIIVMGKWKAIH